MGTDEQTNTVLEAIDKIQIAPFAGSSILLGAVYLIVVFHKQPQQKKQEKQYIVMGNAIISGRSSRTVTSDSTAGPVHINGGTSHYHHSTKDDLLSSGDNELTEYPDDVQEVAPELSKRAGHVVRAGDEAAEERIQLWPKEARERS